MRASHEICQTVRRDVDASILSLPKNGAVRTGECELMGDNVGGIAVHTGARIMTKAEPGGVFVSRTVKDLVSGSGINFPRSRHPPAQRNSRRVETLLGALLIVAAIVQLVVSGCAAAPSSNIELMQLPSPAPTELLEIATR